MARLALGETIRDTQHLKSGRIVRINYEPLASGGWVDLQEDITAACEAERKILWLAKHDTLTELANRFHFRECLDEALRDMGKGKGVAVHWLDLDDFKSINDTYGHFAGDALLRSFATRLRQVLRNRDIVGRLGGDEFAVIQRDVTSQEQAEAFVRRLYKALAEPHIIDGERIFVSTTVGTSFAPRDGMSGDSLMQCADLALYAAKISGRGGQRFFDPEHKSASLGSSTIDEELRQALRTEAFELHYQPIVDVKRGQITSVETLIRWNHPVRGQIPPDHFISIAETTGLIVPIGAWVLQQACSDAVTWHDGIGVTVNVSPVQFARSDMLATVRKVLAETGLQPQRLELEITESTLLNNDTATLDVLNALRALGVGIALDDFGTAFSSLSYLRSFPFNRIKIDRSFVKDLPKRNDCKAIVHAVSSLARALNMVTTAEGVETFQHLDAIRAAGCEEVQGYLFSKPVPAAKLASAINDCRARLMVAELGDGLKLSA